MNLIWLDPPYFAFGMEEELYFGKALRFMSQPALVLFKTHAQHWWIVILNM